MAHKTDFNIFDAFHIFDQNRDGYLTTYEIQTGMNSIGIYCSHDEANLFIQRYDDNGDGRLTSYEFEKAFLTHDPYYSGMVSRRPSNYRARPIRPDDVFYPGTAYEF